jgi:heptosyltransferase I
MADALRAFAPVFGVEQFRACLPLPHRVEQNRPIATVVVEADKVILQTGGDHGSSLASRDAPPASICLLRLSALGDVTHVLPLVHTLRKALPGVDLAWVIGKGEHRLLDGLHGVRFLEYDKKSGIKGMRALRRELAGQRFDALLQMQVAARANLLSAFIPATRRIGYDRSRSKDLHGLFIDERIPDRPGIHVLDAIGSFCEPLGLKQTEVVWNMPVPDAAFEWAAQQWSDDGTPVLMISPCSSHPRRNWRAERYAALADHAAAKGWRIVLCGGRSELERTTGDAIIAGMKHPALDLIGKDTLKQLPALLARANLLVTPDSGPMHIANAMGTKVLGLHAASNPRRSGPYSDIRYCVDRYDDAARKFLGKPAAELKWGTKIEADGVMDLVTVEDAIQAFQRYANDLVT